MSDWVVCPRCHFSQMPAQQCRRCGEALAPPADSPPQMATPPELRKAASRRMWLAALAGVALVLALLWLARAGRSPASVAPEATPVPTPGALDLAGRWHAQLSKMVGANPPRPVLKEISVESERDGGIVAARVVFTDPGRGGAGAGYRIAPDGPRRLSEATALLAAEPKGATLPIDFLRLPGWVPERARLWRTLEGTGHGGETARYLLLESLETDYLVQAGINGSGFLSYAFFSPAYAPARGQDALSRVIHPEPGGSLRGFRNLVWDLSGAADFLTLQLPVTISGPEGGAPDAVTLTR
jgi:hypothetical protein